jgi:hypothetical protein
MTKAMVAVFRATTYCRWPMIALISNATFLEITAMALFSVCVAFSNIDIGNEDALSAQLDHWPAAADELNQQNHKSDHEQNVNESTQCIGADDTQQPQDQQDDEDCPKHLDLTFRLRLRNRLLGRERRSAGCQRRARSAKEICVQPA